MKSNEDKNGTARAGDGAEGITSDSETFQDDGCACPRPGGLSTSDEAEAVASEGAVSDALATGRGTPAATGSAAAQPRLPRAPVGRPAGMATPRARRNWRACAGVTGRSDDSDAKGDRAAAGVASRVPDWAATHAAATDPPPPPRSSSSMETSASSNAGGPNLDDGSGMEPPLQSDAAGSLAGLSAAPSLGVSEPDAFAVEGTDSDGGGGVWLVNALGAGDIPMSAVLAAAESKASAAAVADETEGGRACSQGGIDPSEKYDRADIENGSDSRAAAVSASAAGDGAAEQAPASTAVPGQDPIPGAYQVHRRAPGIRPPRPRTRRARSPRRNHRSAARLIRSFGRSAQSAASSDDANGIGGTSSLTESGGSANGGHDASLLRATAVTGAEPVVYAESVTKEDDEPYRVLLKKRKVRIMLSVGSVVFLGLIALAVSLAVTNGRDGDEATSQSDVDDNGDKHPPMTQNKLCDLLDLSASELEAESKLNQCRCGVDATSALPEYYANVTDIIFEHTMTAEDEVNETSCSHRNMALLWLSEDKIAQDRLIHNNKTNAINDIVQRYVLALLYFAWHGDRWENDLKDGWLSNEDACGGWANLECDQNVRRLRFKEAGLDGTIPQEIGHLSDLMYLDLAKNNFTGPIPTTLFGINNLRVINCNQNYLSGPIPTEIVNATLL